ncbi:unnamed protein product [Heligmosomoides polygyrus]|uniref:Integrase catalytic domain-containing protein n=1 Tax=Heligmosomoides polygyrus TaxID=6339 RepID=A0A183GQW6_HELPZ|nr:unnamed protein product [Heligmosomoides polygyrus]
MELGRLLRINHYFTTPYHHEGNGPCERVFATFQEVLRTYIREDQSDWDLYLPSCTFAYNTSTHSSTNESPFFLVFGRDPILNIDLLLQHKRERHLQVDVDYGLYKESLINSLHEAWNIAAARNRLLFLRQQTTNPPIPPSLAGPYSDSRTPQSSFHFSDITPQLERLNIAEPSDSTPQGTPAPKPPALTEPSTSRADAQISEPQSSMSKSSTLPSTSRNPTSLSAPRRQHTPASSTSTPSSAVPPKSERLSQPEAMPTLDEA